MVVVQPEPQTQAVPKNYSVDLKRSAKGLYYWEITVRSDDPEQVLEMLAELDHSLRNTYKTEE